MDKHFTPPLIHLSRINNIHNKEFFHLSSLRYFLYSLSLCVSLIAPSGVLEYLSGLDSGHLSGLDSRHLTGLDLGHLSTLDSGHLSALDSGHLWSELTGLVWTPGASLLWTQGTSPV